MDRASSPARLRAVTSMKSLLPLHLANPRASLPSRPTDQLRRSHSSPTTPGQLIRDSCDHEDLANSMSSTHSSFSANLQAPIETQSTQALFDIGIFQASARSDVGEEDSTDFFSQCSPPASTPDEALAPSFFGPLPLARPTRSDSGLDSEVRGPAGSWHGSRGIKRSSRYAEEAFTAAVTRHSCIRSSCTSRVIESEAEWLKGDLEQTSWLLDASDEEAISDRVSSNASTEDLKWELESVASTRAESSLEGPDGSVIVSDHHLDGVVCTQRSLSTLQEFATVLSPSRATLVEVSSKRSSTCSIDVRTSSPTTTEITVPGESCTSLDVPVTPPSSPHRTFLDIDSGRKRVETPKNKTTSSMTQLLRGPTSMTPPQTPENSLARPCARHAGLGSILSMLEHAVAGFPSITMTLDAPVIRCMRMYVKSVDNVYNARCKTSATQDIPHTYKSTNASAETETADITWFHAIFLGSSSSNNSNSNSNSGAEGTSTNTLPNYTYAHILSLNFLDDLLLQQEKQEKLLPRDCTTPTFTSPSTTASSAQVHRCDHGDLLDRTNVLRQGLRLCLWRLVESVVGVTGNNEVLLRSLMAVVRLAEGTATDYINQQ